MLLLNNGQLKQFLHKCQKDKIIGIDTEFHRTNTYYPKLCLIQIANLDNSIVLDPISVKIDFSILKKLIYDKKIKKIFFSASQDIEIFFNLYNEIPPNFIDVQICLMPLGYENSTSYSRACKDFNNINISKDHQFIDWRVRPLTNEKIDYAINDVKFLIPLYEKVIKDLEKIKRDSWVNLMHEKIYNIKNYKFKAKNAWEKIKFTPKNSYELETLKKISKIRENYAIEKDKPIKRFLDNKDLIKLCRVKTNHDEKKKIIKKIKYKNLKNDILKIIGEPIPKKKLKEINLNLDNNQKKVLKYAKELLEKKSKELNVHPSLIANKAELEKIVLGDKSVIVNWKYDIFHKEYKLIQKLI